MTTIGSVLHPSWNYDLEASLRVHRLLVVRSLDRQWRFKNEVWTGPFETLMGYPCCGASSGDTSWCKLKLFVRDGLKANVEKLNGNTLRTLCEFPSLARLDETIPNHKFAHCANGLDALLKHESGRTKTAYNKHWKRATLVKGVRLECCDSGVYLAACVGFSKRPTDSSWDLFRLAGKNPPKWNERLRLATWLTKAEKELGNYMRRPSGEGI